MSIIQRIVDKLTRGDKMQYILVGTLILIIIISLLSIFLAGGGKRGSRGRGEPPHFWCIETEKEFILKPEDIGPGMGPGMMPGMGPGMGPGFGRVMSPYTNERTGVPMTKCPECKKWFVPQMYLEPESVDGPMRPMGGPGSMVCTHCNTDIHQWYKDRRKERKK